MSYPPGKRFRRVPGKREELGLGGFAGLAFVGAGAVKTGHRDAEQAVVHPELRAVVDEVVHDESADTSDAWHGENGLAAGQGGLIR